MKPELVRLVELAVAAAPPVTDAQIEVLRRLVVPAPVKEQDPATTRGPKANRAA